MQTNKELIEWLNLRLKGSINIQYDLIDSMSYPEIDSTVRVLRGHFMEFEEKLATIKRLIEDRMLREQENQPQQEQKD